MQEATVLYVLLVVVAAIIIDTLLGAIKAAIKPEETFDIRKLAKFLATGILPYGGALGLLAAAAEFVGNEFEAIFFAAAAAVTAKYLAEIKDKLSALFGGDIVAKG
jgi:hypothetical protein